MSTADGTMKGDRRPADRSHGWDDVASSVIDQIRHSDVGVGIIQSWAQSFPNPSVVLDLGCGPGGPRSEVIRRCGHTLYAVDAAPHMVAAYKQHVPDAFVVCAAVEDSPFCDASFDGVVAWGLLFLLERATQRDVIYRVSHVLNPGGRFLFTAPAVACTWRDLSTGQPSLSLGAAAYQEILKDAGFHLVAQHHDEGQNDYFEMVKP